MTLKNILNKDFDELTAEEQKELARIEHNRYQREWAKANPEKIRKITQKAQAKRIYKRLQADAGKVTEG